MAIGLPVKANYAAGDILTATNMNDLSGTFNNVATSYGNAAGKNKIINGDFGIWQRGTSFSVTGTGSALYGAADRWAYFMNGSGGTNTVSRQTFTPAAAPVAGYEGQFFQRWTTTTVGSGQSVADIRQAIEDVRTFAGQTVTLSYWAKSSSSVTISPIATQNFGSGGSASVDTNFATAALTSSWVRYTASITVPSISGKTVGTSSFLSLNLRCTGFSNGTTIDLWGVQLEAGSISSPFQTASGGSIQGELAMCQRYYFRHTPTASFGNHGNGGTVSTTQAYVHYQFPVQMRTTPSSLDFANVAVQPSGGGVTALSSLAIDQLGLQSASLIATTASTWTSLLPCRMINNNNSAGYVGFSAEL